MSQIVKKIEITKEKIIEEEVETLLRKEIINTVLDKTWLSKDDVKIMRNNECWTSDINIVLAIYHCCGKNLKDHVCDNDSLIQRFFNS